MCGRYMALTDESDDFYKLYQKACVDFPNDVIKTGEIFPSDKALVIGDKNSAVPDTGDNRKIISFPAVWGFSLSENGNTKSSLIINARAESITEKPMFKESFFERRCIVPATGFFEWSKSKEKYLFTLDNSPIILLAGIFKVYKSGLRFTILTTEANKSVSGVHNRMPVIIPREYYVNWIRDNDFALDTLSMQMPNLLSKIV